MLKYAHSISAGLLGVAIFLDDYPKRSAPFIYQTKEEYVMKFIMQAKNVRNLKHPFHSEDPKHIKRIYGQVAISDLPVRLKDHIKEESLQTKNTVEYYVDILRSEPQNAYWKCPAITILASDITFDNRTDELSFLVTNRNSHHGIVLNGNVFLAALVCRDDELVPEPFVEIELIQNLSPEDSEKLIALRQL